MLSIIINGAVAALSVVAWLMLVLGAGDPDHLAARGMESLKYFTVLSNLFSGVISFVYLVCHLMASAEASSLILVLSLIISLSCCLDPSLVGVKCTRVATCGCILCCHCLRLSIACCLCQSVRFRLWQPSLLWRHASFMALGTSGWSCAMVPSKTARYTTSTGSCGGAKKRLLWWQSPCSHSLGC